MIKVSQSLHNKERREADNTSGSAQLHMLTSPYRRPVFSCTTQGRRMWGKQFQGLEIFSRFVNLLEAYSVKHI